MISLGQSLLCLRPITISAEPSRSVVRHGDDWSTVQTAPSPPLKANGTILRSTHGGAISLRSMFISGTISEENSLWGSGFEPTVNSNWWQKFRWTVCNRLRAWALDQVYKTPMRYRVERSRNHTGQSHLLFGTYKAAIPNDSRKVPDVVVLSVPSCAIVLVGAQTVLDCLG